MNVVISQPMYFPWVGLLEQVKAANFFIYYDDVQFSKGSFTNRVQIKTENSNGYNWLTVPLKNMSLGDNINEIAINNDKNWKHQHYELLKQAYRKAPFRKEMLSLVQTLFENQHNNVGELSKESMQILINYFGLDKNKSFEVSSKLGIDGDGSQRVYDIVHHFGGKCYITGHGARHYLSHEYFERGGIEVKYLDYLCLPYPQQHGTFTPYVSSLDLIANCGLEGLSVMKSTAINWKKFLTKFDQN
jgi:hypothetical protein